MFDWVWKLLYGISKAMYAIIDHMLACANMLCGIEPITYEGKQMDFISFLLANKSITYAFVAAVLIGVFLVFVFAVAAIIRTTVSEKVEKTPGQIALGVAKTLLVFLFIPVAMVLLIYFTNIIMGVLYKSTLGGSPDGIGRFLAGAFGMNARHSGVPEDYYLAPDFNYMSAGSVSDYVSLSDYDFFTSWIAGIVIILALGSALLMFIDRAISIVVLFIFSPISLSTSVLDDGARFKLWRDQFIVKFLTGYGCIIAINIYALIVGAITKNSLVFFENTILNNVMKILIIIGGAVSMNRMMALIGNLISQGAGSNELRDNAIAASGFSRALHTAGGVFSSPFRATRSAYNFVRDTANRGFFTSVGQRMGLRTSRDYRMEQGQLNLNKLGSNGAVNNNAGAGAKNVNNANSNTVSNAINGGNKNARGGNNGGGGNAGQGSRSRSKSMDLPGSNMVSNSVNNALHGGDKKDKGNK